MSNFREKSGKSYVTKHRDEDTLDMLSVNEIEEHRQQREKEDLENNRSFSAWCFENPEEVRTAFSV